MHLLANGAKYYPEYLDRSKQEALVEEIRKIVRLAPLYVPKMPKTGTPMRVRMTNCGQFGWVTDQERGYRYQETHPETGREWPEIPVSLLKLWRGVSDCEQEPEACLINFYDETAKMGMHQDRDEQSFDAPVVSISLGDTCLFRLGNVTKGGKTNSFKLQSGDVFVLAGRSRMAYHGVDKIYPGTSTLLNNTGRINLTMRVVG